MEHTIRLMKPEEFEKCANIWDIRHNKKAAHRFHREVVKKKRVTFVYCIDDQFIGEASLVFDRADPDYTIANRRIYFSRLIVKEEFRGQGIGTALADHVIHYATNLGYAEMSIGVDLDNYGALRLYQRLGFTTLLFVGEDRQGKYVKLLKSLS